MAKTIIFTMNTKNGKVNGKKTADSHYYNWNGEKFVRCKKADLKGIEAINFNKI